MNADGVLVCLADDLRAAIARAKGHKCDDCGRIASLSVSQRREALVAHVLKYTEPGGPLRRP